MIYNYSDLRLVGVEDPEADLTIPNLNFFVDSGVVAPVVGVAGPQ